MVQFLILIIKDINQNVLGKKTDGGKTQGLSCGGVTTKI